MNPRIVSLLIKLYPRAWRAEYGQELADLLGRQPFHAATISNVLWSALREQLHRPATGFLLRSFPAISCTFCLNLLFSNALWRVLSAPVVQVLRSQGVRPSHLIAVRPWELAEVVYLGIPLLATLILTYPALLLLAWRAFRIEFLKWSAAAFVVSAAISLIAWQHGLLSILLTIAPDSVFAPMLSAAHLYALLFASTIGSIVALQIPLVALLIAGSSRKMSAR
jgi:hypothetical protein